MKRRSTTRHSQRNRVWTYDEAKTALPYIASIVCSLREHRIDALARDQEARRLAAKPGRPDRAAIMAQEDAVQEARRASDRFEEALEELNAQDVNCLDPIRGQALVPFAHGDELAWYVYDLFEGDELRFWRLHSDPLDTRRPVAELTELPGPPVAA
jgi:Uncharacterized conserved protein (DUF2203)